MYLAHVYIYDYISKNIYILCLACTFLLRGGNNFQGFYCTGNIMLHVPIHTCLSLFTYIDVIIWNNFFFVKVSFNINLNKK